jgi:hypothetical protein
MTSFLLVYFGLGIFIGATIIVSLCIRRNDVVRK